MQEKPGAKVRCVESKEPSKGPSPPAVVTEEALGGELAIAQMRLKGHRRAVPADRLGQQTLRTVSHAVPPPAPLLRE
jgi:hypothetical protein